MLISQHRDGQLIARTVRRFGIASIAGSTSHGGSAALRAILRALKAGQCIGVTPDGPRGPRMRATGGAVDIARLSGVPILPAAFATSRRRVLGSWDRFGGLLRVDGYVASAEGFFDQPAVLDGASELFLQHLADLGRHARSAVIVPRLPWDAPVELVVTFTLRDAESDNQGTKQ